MKDETKKDGFTRREITVAGAVGVAGLASVSGLAASATKASNSALPTPNLRRMPVAYVPHGGGPWPFVDMGGMASPREIEALRAYFVGLPMQLPQKPKALLVISAHWEEADPTVMTAPRPPLFYDYGGFPPEAYTLQWPAPGHPALAQRVLSLLKGAGIATRTDERRGFDHGTFVPFKVSWPDADIPTLQLSMKSNYDPAEHLAIGGALAPLRDEGVLILGSGMSFHNFRSFRTGTGQQDSLPFDAWLKAAAVATPQARTQHLIQWQEAPGARLAHPREDHLLPLMVVAGAAGDDIGRVAYNDDFLGARITALHFG